MTKFEEFLHEINFDNLKSKTVFELEKLLSKIYDYCDEQHGKVNGNFFTKSWKPNNKIKRGNSGLDVHHKMEYCPTDSEVCSLSNIENAKMYPYSYQEAKNLVYCDWIEHQAIHAIIDTLRTRQFGIYRLGCIDRRAPMLNRFFNDGEIYIEHLDECCTSNYFSTALTNIKDELDTYIFIMDEWGEANNIDDWKIRGNEWNSLENLFSDESNFDIN